MSSFHLLKLNSQTVKSLHHPLEPFFVVSWLLQDKFEKRLEETPRKSLAGALEVAATEAVQPPQPLEDAQSALKTFGLRRLDKNNDEESDGWFVGFQAHACDSDFVGLRAQACDSDL